MFIGLKLVQTAGRPQAIRSVAARHIELRQRDRRPSAVMARFHSDGVGRGTAMDASLHEVAGSGTLNMVSWDIVGVFKERARNSMFLHHGIFLDNSWTWYKT